MGPGSTRFRKIPAGLGPAHPLKEILMGRSILLWLLGVPIPIIILIALLSH
jgi:hypothetical protein